MNKLFTILLLVIPLFSSAKPVVNELRKIFYNDVWNKTIPPKIKSLNIIEIKDGNLIINKTFWSRSRDIVYKNIVQKNINISQFISLIDLSRQLYILFLYDNKNQNLHFIGMDLVSTGNIDREAEVLFGEDHYLKTPTGIYQSSTGWRSDGRYNSDGKTKGYGDEGSFVFYFGKQKSIRYNTFDQNGTKIKDKENWKLISDDMQLAMHAHSSTHLLGLPYSHGCIRTTHKLNEFLDNNMVLHKNKLLDNKWVYEHTYPPKKPNFYNYSGKYLIIIDKI